MNQGRIWTVVHPTVGLPLLLGSVTVIAILVHFALLTNTSWFPKYWNGKAAVAAVAPAPGPPPAPAPAPAPPAH
ncbi:light-harvesting protein [Rhodopseudomonas sp. BAL398]|uniref:light-harvesting protein n=1 Tax=Rhodopseudomonas sp. BAL398 TaxID=3034676 RepID=UPI0023E29A75|nr:light-harvesting protein [Rhodopseudomonas sp. BAL398]MDF3813887.1 light-harvesting protein [Rhodopseudomonas sp. BAL398]